ncbi:MAG: hypothetical protein ACR2F1_07875 [Nitrososphaeraceae archaeon]
MPHRKDWNTIQIRSNLLNGLIYESKKQHRSAANLAEYLFLKAGIRMMTDQELEKNLKKIVMLEVPQ